jgi:hypothetical protein
LDKEVRAQKGISAFRFRLRRFSKKEISGIEKEDLSPLFFYLGDKGGFLGDTTKRTSKSPTGFDLAHHIICVNDAELDFGCGLSGKGMGLVQKYRCSKKDRNSFEFQRNHTLSLI